MPQILSGQAASFPVTLQRDGVAVAIAQDAAVTVSVYAPDGVTAIAVQPVPVAAAPGWSAGVVDVTFSAAETTAMPSGELVLAVSCSSPALVKRFRLLVEAAGEFQRSLLFVKDIAVDRIRADSLMMAASGALSAASMSDDYLWDKVRAAESEVAHELRVPLVPTHFFYETPTDAQIAELGAQPWAIDPGYDYAPGDFAFNDKWGFIKLRNKPLQRVDNIRFSYPGGPSSSYKLPLDWVRSDAKYGHVQFVPSSTAFAAPLNTFVMQAIGRGRTIPLAVQFEYVAGLADVHKNYPELIDAILKKAVIKIIEDSFLPTSGSISADGLSQSISNDMDKHRDSVDRIINGDKDSNGGLMASIHGIRYGVIGG